MKKKRTYIAPDIRILQVETQGVMQDLSGSRIEDNTGASPDSPTISGGGSTSDPGMFGSKENSGGLWDYE